MLLLLLFWLFRHSTTSFIAQKEHLAPPSARDSSEVARTLNQRRYPHTGNVGLTWRLSSSLSLPVGFSIQDEAMDVARSAPQRAHFHAGVIYLLP